MSERESTAVDQARWEKWDDLRTRQELASNERYRLGAIFEHEGGRGVELADEIDAIDATIEKLKLEEEALREEGMKELFMQEITGSDPCWYWLSFADGELPEGERFLGVAIVPGSGVMSAAMMAHRFGCNPGGGIQAIEIPPEHVPDEKYRMRLLSKEELEAAGLA